jgi:hypothetical protein
MDRGLTRAPHLPFRERACSTNPVQVLRVHFCILASKAPKVKIQDV